MENKKRNKIAEVLGFYKNSPYVSAYQQDANIRSSIFMSTIIIALELFMILRYVYKYIIVGKEGVTVTVSSFFKYTRSYWILLAVGIMMLVYGCLYFTGKIRKNRVVSNILITVFAGVCLNFGIYVSFSDFGSGRMIICFLTMVLYVACLLIWRPYLSIILLTLISFEFYRYIDTRAVNKQGEIIGVSSGDRINYVTFFISLTAIAISIYHQRHREAIEAEKLYKASVTDDLTGISNMHHFTQRATSYAAEHSDVLYIFFNIENFRTYNNQMGYIRGNEFLTGFGRILDEVFLEKPHARQVDDHFVALTLNEDAQEEISLVQKKLKEATDYEVYIELKAGGYIPGDKLEDADARACIDKARYAAGSIKNRPGELYREYDEEMDKGFRQREYVLNNIDKAVKEGYIKVYYQPVMNSDDEKLCGCEALVRWIDPVVGFLSPGAFVPILEESRQIHKLDRCVYEIVCRDIRHSFDNGIPVVPASLNFSRLDFELMNPIEVLEELVTRYDIPRELLHVEITESALTSDVAGLKRDMDIFHEKGYAIWLDDFGSGYSSLNVLKDFEFDLLKIDMVFLKNFGQTENSKVILKNIIRMANEIGMKTLTEGVETKDAVDFLEETGCGRLQGYFFGKPMPYDDFVGKLKSGEFTVSERPIAK